MGIAVYKKKDKFAIGCIMLKFTQQHKTIRL